MVFRLCLIIMFKEALWVGASTQIFGRNILRCNISESQPLLVMYNMKKENVEWKEHQSLNNRWSYYLAFWMGQGVCLSPAAIYNLGLLLFDLEERSKLKREEMNSSSTSSLRKLPAINPATMSSSYKWVCFLEFTGCTHSPRCSSWSNLPFKILISYGIVIWNDESTVGLGPGGKIVVFVLQAWILTGFVLHTKDKRKGKKLLEFGERLRKIL